MHLKYNMFLSVPLNTHNEQTKQQYNTLTVLDIFLKTYYNSI